MSRVQLPSRSRAAFGRPGPNSPSDPICMIKGGLPVSAFVLAAQQIRSLLSEFRAELTNPDLGLCKASPEIANCLEYPIDMAFLYKAGTYRLLPCIDIHDQHQINTIHVFTYNVHRLMANLQGTCMIDDNLVLQMEGLHILT